MDFAISADHRVKLKESGNRDKYLNRARKQKKQKNKKKKTTLKHESDGDTNCNRYARYHHQRIGTGNGRLGN